MCIFYILQWNLRAISAYTLPYLHIAFFSKRILPNQCALRASILVFIRGFVSNYSIYGQEQTPRTWQENFSGGHGSQRMRERFSHFRWKSVWGRSSRGECIGISYRSAGQSAGYRSRRRKTSRHRWKHCSRCIKCLVKSSACVLFRSLFHLALHFFISLIDYIDWHWNLSNLMVLVRSLLHLSCRWYGSG